jgi:uncharacterized oxidoreductase
MPTLQVDALKQFTQEVLEACSSPAEEAAIVADHLVTSNLLGVDSHGVMRIPQYVREIREGAIRPAAPVTAVKETETTAVVDCGWNFGQVGATRAMEIAIQKTRQHHSSCVITQRCGHVGRLGAYVHSAARQGFVALGVCSSPRHGHFVLPWGGREGRLATNPVAFGIPTNSGPPIVADFSTSAAPEGKIRLYRDQGKRLPEGWIVDGRGMPSTNAADFYGPPMGAILPFGGETGYRGFALSLLVEVLGATMGGQDITVDQPGNGVGFIVIDVSAFLPLERFYELMEGLRNYIKSSKPVEGFEAVLLPGEPEFRTAQARQETGIPLDDATWQAILRCAESVAVKWPAGTPATTPR